MEAQLEGTLQKHAYSDLMLALNPEGSEVNHKIGIVQHRALGMQFSFAHKAISGLFLPTASSPISNYIYPYHYLALLC